MALTKETVIGKMEIMPRGQIQVRTDTVIKEDGKEISRTHHRHVVQPDQDTADQHESVKAVAEAVHTKKIKDDWSEYTAKMDKEFEERHKE